VSNISDDHCYSRKIKFPAGSIGRFSFRFVLPLPNHSLRRERKTIVNFVPHISSILSFISAFFFSLYQAAVSADNAHWPNARCRRNDTDMDRVLHSVSRARSLFNSLSARLLLINLFQSAKLTTLSAAIVTTLIFFLVAAIATRRRRWWRLYHPFRNIGQQIYHCNSFDYDSVLLRMTLMTSHDRHEAYILVENLNFNLRIYARCDYDVPIILLENAVNW
jgi:hypothetical protein